MPQKSKNSHHGLPNPNNHSDLSDHPFRLQAVDNFTETTTLTTFATNNITVLEYVSLNSTITWILWYCRHKNYQISLQWWSMTRIRLPRDSEFNLAQNYRRLTQWLEALANLIVTSTAPQGSPQVWAANSKCDTYSFAKGFLIKLSSL